LADRIGVPLDLEDFEVIDSEVVRDAIEVDVRSLRRPACFDCGSLDVTHYDTTPRRIRDRACGYPVVLRWAQRRFRCADCGAVTRERHPEVAGRRRITQRFRRLLFEQACNEPFVDVAAAERVSSYRVEECFEAFAAAETEARSPAPPRVLSIDESSFKKPLQFHSVLSDPERGVVLDLVEGRGKGAVFSGLARMSDQARAAIETVVIDCHWPYRQAIEQALPRARIVADKFHVIRAVDGAANRVRRRFGRRGYTQRIGRDGGTARQHHPASDPAIFRIRWVFQKRAAKLSPAEEEWLVGVLRCAAPEVTAAWWLKERFAAIYEARDRQIAELLLDEWIEDIERVGLPEFLNTWRTLQWWREEILNYLDDPVTNAFAEGITNKIKVMKRRSYGFRNAFRYRHKVLLACGRRSARKPLLHRLS
jgi:transposase